ncbi:hypothetical protein SDC9_139639 [bioreactor metagenome]|uniref:Uncharacterized protein n=1 Tax=bioreactor metagenome TaxID=1076179 RepID=A0A645DSN9_9ZZZZ
MDFEDVTRLHLRLADVRQRFDASIRTHHAVDAGLARTATRHAKRAMHAAVGENARRHWLQETHAPHATVAAAPAPRAR